MNIADLKHWHCQKDKDDILWCVLDVAGEKVNTLGSPVITELEQLVELIENDPPRAMIIRSGKKAGFIAGADIKQFQTISNQDEALALVRRVQKLFDRIEALNCTTVAMIQGYCLGGGTELVLACKYRVAQDDDKTKIGLPEVKLGICPGWGGTVRLPRLIGVRQAMPLILSGRLLSARAAKRCGMVDAAPPLAECEGAARYFALKNPAKREISVIDKICAWKPLRPLMAKFMRKQLTAKKVSREHYPSPWMMIENWEKYGAKGDIAMRKEADAIAELLISDTSRHLVKVFFLSEAMKSLGKQSDVLPVTHVHVIGAGTMGGDIAAWCALRGMRVTLQDQSIERIAPAIARAAKLYKKKLRKPRLIQAAMDRLMPDVNGDGLTHADCVIEAIFENLQAKQDLFKSVEEKVKPSCILATNTSSIPLDEINVVLQDPSRLVGVHFFNPVAKMPLVEVVCGKSTSELVMKSALAMVTKIGKHPLPVKSSPGFLVNRVLMPYLMEAMEMLESGVPAQVIDRAALKFGMPMGPIRLADTVGLDICYSVADNLSQHLGGKVPERLKKMVEAGDLGCKSGKGFYNYDKKGKPVKSDSEGSSGAAQADCVDRMMLRMLNEAVACLREGVVDKADWVDAGMVFGTGFAPFRGGPLCYAQERGVDQVVERLGVLESKYGERFAPDEGWGLLQKKTVNKAPEASPTKVVEKSSS